MGCETTYQDLAAFATGELEPQRQTQIDQHLSDCSSCRERLTALSRTDNLLASLTPVAPGNSTVLAARRALSELIRGPEVQEIMTLEETAGFLRITTEQLGEIMEELPAFELAGQIRVRRTRLIEWIQQRERSFTRQITESWVARASVHGIGTGAA